MPSSLAEVDKSNLMGFGADLAEDHPVSFWRQLRPPQLFSAPSNHQHTADAETVISDLISLDVAGMMQPLHFSKGSSMLQALQGFGDLGYTRRRAQIAQLAFDHRV